MDDNNKHILESDSLETSDSTSQQTEVEGAQPSVQNPGVISPASPQAGSEGPRENLLKRIFDKISIYILLLILVLVALGGITYYAIMQNRKAVNQGTLTTKKLTQTDLDKLAGSDSTIGDAKQTLSVESNAVFKGGVLVRGNLDIAGSIKVGGPLSLPGLTVGGTANVDQLAAKSLTVAGDVAIQGKVVIQNGLVVTGDGTFNGNITASQITTNKLQLSGDLQLSRHFVPNGGTPGRTGGSALGGGGTASNSGNDITGTVNISTGNSAPAGCFISLTFTSAYSSVPHVIISPASSAAAGIDYYINRSTNGFSVCTASDAPDNTSGIVFDYIVMG